MSFDPDQEYGAEVSSAGFPSGKEYIDAVIEDARKVLPQNTEFWFISWNEEGKRKCGWVYNLKMDREQQKLFNPLKSVLRT